MKTLVLQGEFQKFENLNQATSNFDSDRLPYEWEKFLENAKAFNSKYKDYYPNQGDAPIELIIEKIMEKDFYI